MKKVVKQTITNECGYTLVTIPAKDGLRQVKKLDRFTEAFLCRGVCVLSDTAIAYLNKCLSKMAYSCLANRYAKAGNIEQLRIIWSAFSSFIRENNIDYKEMVETMFGQLELTEVIVHNTMRITVKWTEIDEKTHKKVEKRKHIEIPVDEWEEIKYTFAGKMFIIDTILEEKAKNTTVPCIEFDDVLNEAWTACMQLENFGLLVDFDSIWCLKAFIYRHLNRFLDNYSFYSVSLDDDSITGKRQEVPVMDDDTKVILREWAQEVKKHNSKRFNAEQAFISFVMFYFYGYKQVEIASKLKIESQSKVSRLIAKTKIIIENYTKTA